jgi:hypothetical protein
MQPSATGLARLADDALALATTARSADGLEGVKA